MSLCRLNTHIEQMLGSFEVVVCPAARIDQDVSGKIVLFPRGEISFLSKVLLAVKSNAAGVLIYNNNNVPFIMTDSTSTKCEYNIPVFMIPNSIGLDVVKSIQNKAQDIRMQCSFGTKHVHAVCSVCRDSLQSGVILPCKHSYHLDCIKPWLLQRNNCPLCRYEVPTGDPVVDAKLNAKPAPTANDDNYRYLQQAMWG